MFRTLDDLKKGTIPFLLSVILLLDKKDNKDKKTTSSYAGGEKRYSWSILKWSFSGLAIENPEDIHGILEKAERYSILDVCPITYKELKRKT